MGREAVMTQITFYQCDRCGEKLYADSIGEEVAEWVRRGGNLNNQQWHLCRSCSQKASEFIEKEQLAGE